MRDFTLLLFTLFIFSIGCCGYNSYISSKNDQLQLSLSNSPLALASPIANQQLASATSISQPSSGSPNSIAQNPPSTGQMTAVKATFYTDVGLMADGHSTHPGACAAYIAQFPFGTMLKLYHPNDLNQPAYTCTIEDSGTHICQGNIDVWIASVPEALQLGVEDMQAQVVGFDKTIAQDAANNHPASLGCELGTTH
jgi:3D (Asp-Asp-Asp) domain-containing protein